ncbi:MAG TPA: hypothetical protein ENK48_01280 [Gammaproteobacteria bacterium]|nr:hypothetical protein [Gammaproteobacteria bacterium]
MAAPTIPPPHLVEACARFSTHPPVPALEALCQQLGARHGKALRAVLYYGSCLRGGDPFDGLVDLYVVVDGYRQAGAGRGAALLNRLLPPNVFYMETSLPEGVVRCKYALMALDHLAACVGPRCFHSYFWARLAQPMGLLHPRDPATAQAIHALQAGAVLTFTRRVLPLLPEVFTTADLWRQGLRLTYGAELRVEGGGRADEIFRRHEAYCQAVTPHALRALGAEPVERGHWRNPASGGTRRRARMGWGVRTAQGKLLSVLRLLKAFFTFEGGLDYLAWKLERHSGVPVEITPRLRRWPLIFIWGLMWRLYRQGVFR